MKVKDTNGKAFSPMTINITIESAEEAKILYSMFNMSTQEILGLVKANYGEVLTGEVIRQATTGIYESMERLTKDRGIDLV